MEQGASKRRRVTERAAAPLSAHHAAAVERIARELTELAGAAPDVPQLAECSAQLTTLLEQQQHHHHHHHHHQQQQQQLGSGAAVAVALTVAPFDSLPEGVVEHVLLHCDARSLGRMSCASRFFGGGQQRSLVERVASCPARLRAVLAPALRPHEVTSRTLQLWRQENPVALGVELLCELAEKHAEAPNRRDEALRLYRRALEAEPNDVETLNAAAELLENEPSGREEAGALYRRLLVLEPDNVNALSNLANLLSDEPGGCEEAEALYRRALVLNADDVEVLFNLASLLDNEPSGCEEAGALYRRLLVVAPDDVYTLNNLANLLSDEPGGREEAEALYRRALAVDPDDVFTLNNLANLLSGEPNDREEAEALIRRALVLEPNKVTRLDTLGYILSKDPERLDEAEQVLRRALEIEPNNAFALASVGVLLSARGGAGDLSEALRHCQQAVVAAASKGTQDKRIAHAHTLAAQGIVLLRSGDAVAARARLAGAQVMEMDASCVHVIDLSVLLEQRS